MHPLLCRAANTANNCDKHLKPTPMSAGEERRALDEALTGVAPSQHHFLIKKYTEAQPGTLDEQRGWDERSFFVRVPVALLYTF